MKNLVSENESSEFGQGFAMMRITAIPDIHHQPDFK
jgi:hypothetical protein